jgi:hypothetical protein
MSAQGANLALQLRISLRIPLPCAPSCEGAGRLQRSAAVCRVIRAGCLPGTARSYFAGGCAAPRISFDAGQIGAGLRACAAPPIGLLVAPSWFCLLLLVVKEPLRCFVLRWMNYTKAKRDLQAKFTHDAKILRDGGARNMILSMDSKTLIKALGGTKKVAELCEITPGSVSLWHQRGIPHAWMKYLRAARPKTFIRLEREAAARAAEAERASSAA